MTANTNTKLEAALDLARRGWFPFPCRWPYEGRCTCWKGETCKNPGKHPMFDGWEAEATNDPAVIRRWWRNSPYANIGLACGRAGIAVLDVDVNKGAENVLYEYERQHGRLPHTPQSLTGSGGVHHLLQMPDVPITTITALGGHVGLDIRANGGLIIAPGSVHASGRTYVWEPDCHPAEVPLAPMPAWLVDMATKAGDNKRGEPIPDVIPEGMRNATLLRLAGSMRRIGAHPDSIFAALAVENAKKCDPPLSDDEIQDISQSICRYSPQVAPETSKSYSAPKVAASITMQRRNITNVEVGQWRR